ncbi:MAG: dodecin family protein [Candidatus Hodarchaeales archaeon]|jgi:flavin-binding protein dodecin
MTESTYKVISLVGSSPTSWEQAVQTAVETASKSLRDLRIVTVDQLDCRVEEGKIAAFRARVRLSFKMED